MKHVRPIALAVIAMIGVAFVAIATAQDSPSANVEVRVWQSTRDAERLWISARPEGGNWATLGTIPLSMEGENSRRTLRYEDITLAVPVGGASPIDESPVCAMLVDDAQTLAGIEITSCTGTFHSCDDTGNNYECYESWGVKGILTAYGNPTYFSGSGDVDGIRAWQSGSRVSERHETPIANVVSGAIAIWFYSNGPCEGFEEWLDDRYPGYFTRCVALANYITNTYPRWNIEGRYYVENDSAYASVSAVFRGTTIQRVTMYSLSRFFHVER